MRISEPKHVISIMRDALKDQCTSYLILVNRNLRYERGRSRIIYIGETIDGIRCVAESTASRTHILREHGVRELNTYTVSCTPCQGSRRKRDMWRDAQDLERAMLKVFEDLYGRIPKCNQQGPGPRAQDALERFSRNRICGILRRLSGD